MFFSLVLFLPIALAATIPVPFSAITATPNRMLARATTATSCTVIKPPALGIVALPKVCKCNDGIHLGASSSVGQDGRTSWTCAAASKANPTSVENAASTPTWIIKVDISNVDFMIGDYNPDDLEKLMARECNDVGCLSGEAQQFQFNWTQSGGITPASGTITMEGSWDQSNKPKQILLNVINTALMKTKNCTTVSTFENNPALLGVPGDTGTEINVRQCHLANSITATVYNGRDYNTAKQMMQISMQGQSENPNNFLCESFLGTIQTALGVLPVNGLLTGGVAVIEAFCPPA